jgi:hypothetical protein
LIAGRLDRGGGGAVGALKDGRWRERSGRSKIGVGGGGLEQWPRSSSRSIGGATEETGAGGTEAKAGDPVISGTEAKAIRSRGRSTDLDFEAGWSRWASRGDEGTLCSRGRGRGATEAGPVGATKTGQGIDLDPEEVSGGGDQSRSGQRPDEEDGRARPKDEKNSGD